MIPECPAYEICRKKKASCDICQALSIKAWQEHVRKVLARKRGADLEQCKKRVKRRQRTHAASGGASEALPHEVGARPSRSEPKLNTHALYPSRSELRGITFKNK
jgi:hypothetical protein